MHFIKKALISPFLIATSVKILSAQTSTDSAFVAEIQNHIIQTYTDQLNNDALIYNGKLYRPVFNLEQGQHTMFLSNQYTRGSLTYKDVVYRDVNLMYDLVQDQLVLLSRDKVSSIVVWPQYVRVFSLLEHKFVRLGSESAALNGISVGYYQLLYEGKTSLYAKRTKKITESTDQHKIKRTVIQNNRYFLFKDSTYTSVKNKKDLLKQLRKTHNEDLKYHELMKHLNFKKDMENSMVKLLKHYDSTQ